MRATTTIRTRCVQPGMGHTPPFSRRSSWNAAEGDPRPNILQLNTEGLTENKISVIEQLAYKNKAYHRPTGDPLCNCRQASDSQLLTTWVNSEQQSRPCHLCPRANSYWWIGVVTGRSVPRTIRDLVVVHRRRRIQNHQRLQTFTLATQPNDHLDLPTPQSVCWRLQLPACQLGLQHPRTLRAWSAVDKVTCWQRILRIAFQLKRRPELCLLTSQQPTTPYGTIASPASCCDCCLIDTWSTWSCRWLAIAALPLPLEMAKGAGYDASRTVSHRDLSWHPFSTSLICQTLSP